MGKSISKKRAKATIGRGMKRDNFESIVTERIEQSEPVIDSAVEEHRRIEQSEPVIESAVEEEPIKYHNKKERQSELLLKQSIVRQWLLKQSLRYSTWYEVERAARLAVKAENYGKRSLVIFNKVVNVQEFKNGDCVIFHITVETKDADIFLTIKPEYEKLYYWARVLVGPKYTVVVEVTFMGYTYRYKS